MSAWVSPLYLTSFSSTTLRAGMLMPRARVSVAKTTFTSPPTNALLDALLEGGQQPGVVGGDAPRSASANPAKSSASRSPRSGPAVWRSAMRAQLAARSAAVVSRSPELHQLPHRGVAARPGEKMK